MSEKGRQLAVKMSLITIKITLPNPTMREKLRPAYAEDAGLLIAVGQVVATEFVTIAAANNYWR